MTQEQAVEAVRDRKKRAKVVRLYRDYRDGKHYLQFASRSFREHYDWVLASARENLCEAIVTSFTGNVGVQSWQGGDGRDATEAARALGMRKIMNMVHDESYTVGDGYVLVWNDSQGVKRPFVQVAEEVYVSCEPGTNRVVWAAKMWIMDDVSHDPDSLGKRIKRARVNVYTELGCERYYAPGFYVDSPDGDTIYDDAKLWPEQPSSWQPYDLDEEGSFILKPSGVRGCGMHWFPHNQAAMGKHGRSILRHVISIQDALNHSLATLIVGNEAYAQPLRLLLGIDPDDDQIVRVQDGEIVKQSKQKIEIDPTRQSIVGVPRNADGGTPTAFQFDPPDATKIVSVQDSFALKMARVVGIPSYYLTQTSGDVPSGQALRVLRERMTSEVSDFQEDVNDEWLEVMADLGHTATLEWKDPSPMDPLEKVQIAEAKKRIGYPFEEILIDLGEQPDDIVRILKKREEDQQRQAEIFQQRQASGLAFLQGNNDGPPDGGD